MRIDQVTPGVGVAGRSRHDLVPNEIITLTATSPAPGPGVSFAWEIIDKRGSAGVLSAGTGTTVSIGINTTIVRPCAFLIELVANDNGVITRTRRIASVRTAVAGLRVPVFPETAPDANKFSLNDPDLSTDNALYADRSGLGSQQNWSGWAEWAWELTMAVEAASGSGPPSGPASGDLGATYPSPQVVGIRGRAVHTTSPANGNVYYWDNGNSRWDAANALGDVTGGWRALVVGKLQGRAVSASAPSDGDVLTWNNGGSTWEPAAPAGGGGAFIFRPGGVAAGNVYTTWATLHAAVDAFDGEKLVLLDDSAGVPSVSAGTWDISGWTFRGFDPTTTPVLNWPDGTAITSVAGFRLVLDNVQFLGVHSSGYIVTFTSFATVILREGADVAAGSNPFFRVQGFGNPLLTFRLEKEGTLGIGGGNVCETAQQGVARVDFLDGSGDVSVTSFSQSGAGQGSLRYYFYGNGLANYAVQSNYTDSPELNRISSLKWVDVIVWPMIIDAQQAGTTELHVGSVYLKAGTVVQGGSAAMLGGAAGGQTASLRMRRFTGGTVTGGDYTTVGTLAEANPLGGEFTITDSDWYEFYIFAGNVAHTAIIKGLRLLIQPSVENGL